MTKNYTHELSPIEIECGITLEQVAELLPKALLIESGTKIVFPVNTGAALASSTARCAFAGETADFAGLNQLTQPVYRRA